MPYIFESIFLARKCADDIDRRNDLGGKFLVPTILRVNLTLFSTEKVKKDHFFKGKQQFLTQKQIGNQNCPHKIISPINKFSKTL